MQACADLRGGRGGTAFTQAHWHRTSAARFAGRGEMLRRGDPVRMRPAPGDDPRGVESAPEEASCCRTRSSFPAAFGGNHDRKVSWASIFQTGVGYTAAFGVQ